MITAALLSSAVLIAVVILWFNRSAKVSDMSKGASLVAVPTEDEIAAAHAENHAQDAAMTHEQIMERSRNDLSIKTSAHAGAWKLGKEERWDWDGDKGTLIFTFKDKVVRTRAQLVGSYVYSRRSWLWAWANNTIPEDSKSDSKRVREHMVQRRVAGFDHEELFVDEQEAWDFAALACYLTNAEGAYGGGEGDMRAFFTFHEVEIMPRR
ncbi:DUF6882 domain-containing protein [Prosthecobacter sp.]|uniref:DUF6882 domain-containing protein n=1 Tax=Prosthecobacter sp. TaxID=1965333 RepID=UPI0037834B31